MVTTAALSGSDWTTGYLMYDWPPSLKTAGRPAGLLPPLHAFHAQLKCDAHMNKFSISFRLLKVLGSALVYNSRYSGPEKNVPHECTVNRCKTARRLFLFQFHWRFSSFSHRLRIIQGLQFRSLGRAADLTWRNLSTGRHRFHINVPSMYLFISHRLGVIRELPLQT